MDMYIYNTYQKSLVVDQYISSELDLSDKEQGLKIIQTSEFPYKGYSEIKILNSNIGVAVKDFSEFINEKININNTSICIQAFQKKQEFGGANINLNNVICPADYQVDNNSIIKFR